MTRIPARSSCDAREKNFVYQVLRRGRAPEPMKIPADQPLHAGLRVERLAALGVALRAPVEGLEAMRAALDARRG